ncbi:MAG: fimbria/pilus periplasmic chaperone [Hyphomicrobiales bacterium]|nr:fimbria/pilus periplasmic chaperone [Hyphomicrobiales bacterium]
MQFKRIFSVAIALLSLSAVSVGAMSVEPMVLDVTSAGTKVNAAFNVSNITTSSMPVEITVAHMELEPDGDAKYTPAEDDFLIFPPLASIPAGGAQTFRVQWIGDPDIDRSRNYRISVSQVPVKKPEGSSGIQITLSFGVVVSVSPLQSQADISVTRVKSAKSDSGADLVELNVKNAGNKHAYMRYAALRLASGNWSQILSAHEMEQKIGLGIVQPGKERRFILPIDLPPDVSNITASLDYAPEN